MKSFILKCMLYALIIAGFIALRPMADSSFSGKVTPPDAGASIWAIMGTDTVKGTAGMDGTFLLTAKPGVWKVMIAAKPPYKSFVIEKVDVTEGNNTDLGEIKLEQ